VNDRFGCKCSGLSLPAGAAATRWRCPRRAMVGETATNIHQPVRWYLSAVSAGLSCVTVTQVRMDKENSPHQWSSYPSSHRPVSVIVALMALPAPLTSNK
jgi:hypothetical protein